MLELRFVLVPCLNVEVSSVVGENGEIMDAILVVKCQDEMWKN